MKHTVHIALLVLAVSGCAEREIPTPTLTQDLSVAPQGQAPSIPLGEVKLETQDDFDDFEMNSVGALGIDGLIDVMRALAEGSTPGERPQDALLLLRLALLELRSESGDNNLQRAIAIAERLHEEAPESPHASFLAVTISGILLRKGEDQTFQLNTRTADVARRLREHLVVLLRRAPDYDGPGERDARKLRAELAALTGALRDLDAPARAQETAAATTAVRATDELVEARSELTRYERGTNVERVTLCRDQVVDGFPATENAVGQWLLLRCAVTLKLAGQGYGALRSLVQAGATQEACLWSARLPETEAKQLAKLNEALAARGQVACATP
jgi:hypothetical protein